MSNLAIVIIVFVSIFVYGACLGITWRMFPNRVDKDGDPHVGPVFLSIVWPVMLPALIGIRAVARWERRARERAVPAARAHRDGGR